MKCVRVCVICVVAYASMFAAWVMHECTVIHRASCGRTMVEPVLLIVVRVANATPVCERVRTCPVHMQM